MGKYTAEQVEAEADCLPDAYEDQAAKLRDYAALLRERESAKAGVTSQMRATACDAYDKEMVGHGETANPVAMRAALEAVAPMLASARVPDETRGTYACPICGKEYPHYHPEDTLRVNWHSDYRKVFEDIISANVRLYKDGVSIAPTNYSHESKLTVAGSAGHWFAYGAEDARSFGRRNKGTDSSAWSEFASNGDGYAYAWMDSLWSLFKQTVVALKGREAVAPMLASARVPGGSVLVPVELCRRVSDTLGRFVGDEGWGVADMDTADEFGATMLAAAPKPESPADEFNRRCESGTNRTKPEPEKQE